MKKIIAFVFLFFSLWANAQNEQLAQNYYDRGEFEKAVVSYEELLKNNPGNSLFFQRTVECYQQLQQFDKAEKLLLNKKEINYLYNTKGELLINQPLSSLKGIKGNDKRYDSSFIIGFYIKDLEGRESLVNLDFYNDNKLSYVLKDVFSIELDNKKSKEELAIAYVKQTATSAVETKYFRVEESRIILLDNKKDSQYIQENTGPKKKKEGFLTTVLKIFRKK